MSAKNGATIREGTTDGENDPGRFPGEAPMFMRRIVNDLGRIDAVNTALKEQLRRLERELHLNVADELKFCLYNLPILADTVSHLLMDIGDELTNGFPDLGQRHWYGDDNP